MLQLSLTTQTLLLSLSNQSSTFCQCCTLSSVLTLCSSLALTLTSPTVSLFIFCLLSHLSSLILSSVLSLCCLNNLAFTSDRLSGISHEKGLGGGGRKGNKARQWTTTQDTHSNIPSTDKKSQPSFNYFNRSFFILSHFHTNTCNFEPCYRIAYYGIGGWGLKS